MEEEKRPGNETKQNNNNRNRNRNRNRGGGERSGPVLTTKPPTNTDHPIDKKKKKRNRNKKKQHKDSKDVVPQKREREEEVDEQAAEPVKKPALTEAEQRYRDQVFTKVPFTDLQGLSAPTLRALKQFEFATMTRIQSLAIPAALSGKDVLIRAKTGHGKTLAFGVPLFEHLEANKGAQALVVAPTRELALQTKKVFEKLAAEHGLRLTCFIGGTNMGTEMKSYKTNALSVLIATPGRLLDHLLKTPQLLGSLQFLVLDEADRLLDEGFQRDMEQIFQLLPQNRRTILASATLPQNMGRYRHLCLREDHVAVSAIPEGSDATNAQLQESVMEVTLDNWLSVLFHIVWENFEAGLKTIVFMQAAQQTKLMALLLSSSPDLSNVFEIHSRLSQSQRIKQLELFKKARGGSVLCSSDVGARGWDIDGVDLVIQLGIPSDNDTYVHRVGRTARAGTNGAAVCLTYQWEMRHFKRRFSRVESLLVPTVKPTSADEAKVRQMLEHARAKGDSFHNTVRQGYSAFLGYQNSSRGKNKNNLSAENCVATVNQWVFTITGLHEPPTLEAKTVGKMGLRGTPGLKVLKGPSGGGRR